MAPDRVIRWTTAVAVIAVAAVASYLHAYDLVRAHGEAGWTARLVPLTVDGLIYASSMLMLDCARRKALVPALGGAPERMPDTDPLQAQAARAFAVELAAGRVPSVRAIRARLHVWASQVPSGYAHTWPRSTARRRACPSNIGLESLRFGRLPYGTPDEQRENIRRSAW